MATDIKDLNPAQQLDALLDPKTPDGQVAVEKDETLKRLSGKYKDALANKDTEAIKVSVADITRELNGAGLFAPDPGLVLNTFDTSPFETRRESTQAPESQVPGLSLQDFLGPKKDQKASSANADTAKEDLRIAQKNATLQAFERLLATTPADRLPEAIDNFYHAHMSAAGVLGNQYKILLDQTRKLYGGGKNGEEFAHEADEIEQEADEKVRNLRAIHTTYGPLTEKDSKQKDIEDGARSRLQDIAGMSERDRNRELEALFNAEWNRRRGEAVDEIVEKLRGVANVRYNITDDIEVGQDIFETYSETPQSSDEAPEGGAGGPSQPGQRGKPGKGSKPLKQGLQDVKKGAKDIEKLTKKKVVRDVEKKAIIAGVRSGLGATIEVWGPPFAIGCGILALIALVIIIVIVILMNRGGDKNAVNAAPGVDSVIQLTNKFLTCEQYNSQGGRNYILNYRQPSRECIQALINSSTSENEKRGLTNARDARKPLQCGVFIESALMAAGWKIFPPTAPTVIWWFLNFFNHTFDGYRFIDNNRQTQGSDAIQPGDIIIYGPGSPGHISFVTSLPTDGTTPPDHFHIRVAEANFREGVAWFRDTTIDHHIGGNRILGWWRKTE